MAQPNQNYCENCDSPIQKGAIVCPRCGFKQRNGIALAHRMVRESENEGIDIAHRMVRESGKKGKKPRSGNALINIFIAVCVIGFVTWFLFPIIQSATNEYALDSQVVETADFKFDEAIFTSDSGWVHFRFSNNGTLTALDITVYVDFGNSQESYIQECEDDEYIIFRAFLEEMPYLVDDQVAFLEKSLEDVRVNILWTYLDKDRILNHAEREYYIPVKVET